MWIREQEFRTLSSRYQEHVLPVAILVLDYRTLPMRQPEEDGISQATGATSRILK